MADEAGDRRHSLWQHLQKSPLTVPIIVLAATFLFDSWRTRAADQRQIDQALAVEQERRETAIVLAALSGEDIVERIESLEILGIGWPY